LKFDGVNQVKSHRGFTLIELMVVIFVVAILIALLLPAAQAARESVRQSTCRNNLRSLGLALHNYHDVHQTFPPASVISLPSHVEKGATEAPGKWRSWLVLVLPYMEGAPLAESMQLNPSSQAIRGVPAFTTLISYNAGAGQPLNGSSLQELSAGKPPRGTAVDISAIQCPSDKNLDVKFQFYIGSNPINVQPNQIQMFARSNYAVNSCLSWPYAFANPQRVFPNPLATLPNCGGPEQDLWAGPAAWKTRGVMGASCSLPIKKIKDGTSHTLLMAEVRAGINKADPRGIWAPGGPGLNALWHHGMTGPNSCSQEYGEYFGKTFGESTLAAAGGSSSTAGKDRGRAAAIRDCMPIQGETDFSTMMSSGYPRSMHVGGVNACMADGSVQFISDFIEHGTESGFWEWEVSDAQLVGSPTAAPRFLTWERLNASADSLVIDEERLDP